MIRIMLVFLVSGCGLNPQYMEEKRLAEVETYATACEKLSLRRGTLEHADCTMRGYDARHRP